jgi:hypothetical protein
MAFQMLRVQALGAQGAAMADRHRLNELVDHRVRKTGSGEAGVTRS